MNWRRGLFRLWVVGTMLWAVGIGGSTWWTYPKPNVVSEAELVENPARYPKGPDGEITDPALLAQFEGVDERGRRVVSKEEFRNAQVNYWRGSLSFAALVGI